METVRLFREHPEVLGHYQERFEYVLIDEYQDTNRAQYHLVNLLAAKHRNLCVVGDADQGVYSWRGATIKNLLDFEHDYPDAAIFVMEQNYRSTQSILQVANALIEHNVQRKPKSLWTESEPGELVVRYRAENEHDEAWFVASEIDRLVEEEGFRYGDVAVFYRTNAQSRVLEDVFMRAGLAYRVVGGVRFYQRRRSRTCSATCAAGEPRRPGEPSGGSSTPRSGGSATPRSPPSSASRATEDIALSRPCRRVDEIIAAQHPAKGAVAGFVEVIDRAAGALRRRRRPGPHGRGGVHESGYLIELEEERTVEAQGRIENLRELVGVAAEFERGPRSGARRLPGAGRPGQRGGRVRGGGAERHAHDPAQREGTRVRGGVHGRHGGRRVPALPLDDRRAELEEERRLAYVGITRARSGCT